MNNDKVDWKGNFIAVITPFTKDGEIDEAKYIENLELLTSEGANGFVVSGCTGETWALSGEEKLRIFKLAADVAGDDLTVVAGTGLIVTRDVIELSKAAMDVGVDGILLLPPYYAIINEKEVMAHFKAISDEVKAPIMLYNMVRRTSINMLPAMCDKLADLEWVVAIKESSNDFIQVEQTLAAAGDRMLIFAGHSAERGGPAVLMGCPGFVSSLEAQIMGREAIELFKLAAARDIEGVRRTQMKTLALDKNIRRVGMTFPGNIKTAMNMIGRPGGFVRPPLLEADKDELAETRAVLGELGLLP